MISLPIIKIFVLISTKIIKGEHDKRKVKQWRKAFNHINRRFLKVPEIAEEQIKKEIKDIMDLSRKNMNINVSEILEQNNHYTEEIYVTNDLINFLNFDLVKFLVKLSQQVKSELSDETTNNFLLLNHIIKINRYITEINEINIAMKNKEIKFDENSIKSINSLNELINQLFDLAIKYIDNIQDNKNGPYMAITEKFKYLKNNLFQENSNNIITGRISVALGFKFIFIISNFEKICILLIKHKHKNSMQTDSTSRNRLSLKSDSSNVVHTGDKINKSIN